MSEKTEFQIGREAVRAGDTVRRPLSFSSGAVHELLAYLRSAGIGVPRVLGVDDLGREVLSWVEGVSGQDSLGKLRPEVQPDEVLVEVARLIRHVHDATLDFDTRELHWNPLLQDPSGSDEIICHNDLGFWNMIFRDERPVAVIDWEFAAPGSRLWDLAYAAWWLVPLHRPEAAAALGWMDLDQPRRLRLFCDAYGLGEQRRDLLETIEERQRVNQRQLQLWMADGIIPPFDENDPEVECGRTDYVEGLRPQLEKRLLE